MDRENHTGLILKAIRLYYDYNQSDFANILGVSQATLSKIEAHRIGISADQWINLCIKFKIDPHCLMTGTIQALPRNIDHNGFHLPEIYSNNTIASVRYILPFIKVIKNSLGEKYYLKLLKDNNLNAPYFCVLSNQINSDLIKLFFMEVYKLRKLNNELISELLDLLKYEDILPSHLKSIDQTLTIEEKYQKILRIFNEYFEHKTPLSIKSQREPLVFLNQCEDESLNFYNMFKLEYIKAFIALFESQFKGDQWIFKIVKSDLGVGLYHAC